MCTKIRKIDRKETIHILIIFSFIVFGILGICGTLTSGIHLVDDHEFWEFSYVMKNGTSYWDLVVEKVREDSFWRFRPLYFPVRVLLAKMFGTNLLVLSVLKALEVVIASVLIYLVARKIDCSRIISYATVAMVLVGPQSATWWKLGPQELTGTWIFALGIWCLLCWKESQKKWYNVIAIFSFFITSLYKESFIGLFPAVMLIYVYLSMKDKEVTWRNIWYAIKENLISEIILGAILLVEAYLILFVIGTNNMEYIAVGGDTSLWIYIKTFLNNFRLHLRIGQYGFFVLAVIVIIGKDIWKLVVNFKWQILLACVMVLPQFVLYAKSGLEERYVIPWIYGVAYLFVIILGKENIITKRKKQYYNMALTALLVINFCLMFYEASYFAYRGRGITQMFNVVSEIATEDTKVMTAFYPYEESFHTSTRVLRAEGINDVYFEKNYMISKWDGVDPITFDEVDIVLTYNKKDRHYLYDQGLDLSDFEVVDYNTVTIAVRKDGEEYHEWINK